MVLTPLLPDGPDISRAFHNCVCSDKADTQTLI